MYDSIRSSGSDALTTNAYDEVISSKIQEVADLVGKTPLRNMSMEQLEAVHDLYTMVAKSISTANKTFKAARSESISQLGTAVMKEVYTVGGSKNDSIKALEGVKGFVWNNLKPVYAFKAIGSETLCQLFENVRAGEDVWAVDVQEAKEFYRKQAEQFG